MSCKYSWSHDITHHPMASGICLATALLLSSSHSSADQTDTNRFIDDVNVEEEDGIYTITLSSSIDASSRHVRDVITDYSHIYRLSDSITGNKVSITDDGNKQVETRVLCCIPIFCKELTRTEEVMELESGDIKTVIVPEKSHFRSGQTTWSIKPSGQSTTSLKYEAQLEPDFFIPPILGTEMVIDNMREEFSVTVARIQHIARINEEKEWNDSMMFANRDGDIRQEPCDSKNMGKH